jgi:hypothetical protein
LEGKFAMSDIVKRPVRRWPWFLSGFCCGILLMLIVANSPDKVVENFHAWVNVFTGSADQSPDKAKSL